tara:strand:- start:250 stop:840 length:591 start_codon:yes stop_codon:yes gene_type:complete
MKEQLELFENFLKQEEKDIPDRFDVTEVMPIEYEGKPSTSLESANRLIDKTKNLPSNRYFVYKEGWEKFPDLPFVKNEKTGKAQAINDSRHSYPCTSFGGIPWDMHKLVGHAFVHNPDRSKKLQIDHINEDLNYKFALSVINSLGWKRAAPHMADFRVVNLRWVSNSENQKFKNDRKKEEKDQLDFFTKGNHYFLV